MTVRHDGTLVEWLGYATARLETADGFVAYLDPGRYGVLDDYDARDGDLVCVTHVHHYDPDGIERVAKEDATVVVYEGVDAADSDRDLTPVDDLPYEVVRVGEAERLELDGAEVRSLPAYNEPDGPHVDENGEPHHPRGLGVAFLLALGDTTVFWPGDSDALEAFRDLDASLFLANIGGSVVMDRREAAALAEALDPDLVLPIHYDTFDLLEADSAAFAADVAGRGVPVVLDERGVS
ncbi:MBL fold metallo-hydrolase [Halegenticoccus tardaugens]|uniref:MBL fold metallo-hydrolase n=1 Tax=Halegenticoccus tardaugens TaxID=2071624 RepID=UPI00100B3362|nr:MBL fold metallo-hydrolase [Halegenticoccus tardaugens]